MQNMPCSPDSLFKLSMNFVAKHVAAVESFLGFPSLIAEKIFKKFAEGYTGENNDTIYKILRTFSEAYENLVLERLNLSGKLLLLNEHLEILTIISRFITELCVCNCFLGENHDLFSHISEFKCLRKLCMKDNYMNNSSMRILTLRIRMYGVGGKEVEVFDVAGNSFTDDIIPWLCAFPKLQYLNLSGSKISEKGIQILANQYCLRQVFEQEQHKDVISEGWAAIILEKWAEENENKRKRKEKKPILNRNLKTVKPFSKTSSQKSLVFRKFSSISVKVQSEARIPAVKKIKITPEIGFKKIEDDIFSQYK